MVNDVNQRKVKGDFGLVKEKNSSSGDWERTTIIVCVGLREKGPWSGAHLIMHLFGLQVDR